MNGYIKLHRKMLEWEWIDDAVTLQVYIYCLLSANFETARWHGILIEPGQFITSIGHIAEDLHISKQKVRTALVHLKSTHNLTCKATSKYTLVTVENWEVYQSAGEKVTHRATQCSTIKQQSNNIQLTTNKERKEEKEEKEIFNTKGADLPFEFEYREPDIMSEEESAQLLHTAHDQFAPIKARLMAEAAERIKQREVKQ